MAASFQLTSTPQESLILDNLSFEFPQPLTEKYRPRRVAAFVGLDKAKRLASNLIAQPKPINLFFLGPSGTGKTTMARAIAEEMPCELHHIPSRECDIETVRALVKQCWYVPRLAEDWQKPSKMHMVLADEADSMSRAAQDAFLSVLDGTSRPPNTIFIFTGNSIANLEDRFMSRCQLIEFSSYGIAKDAAALLEKVWDTETDNPCERPNFQRIVKESNNNVRAALMALESEIMSQ
jgi:replication-associated recombination protein RarA